MEYNKKDVPDHFMRRWQGYADLMARLQMFPLL